MILALQYWSGDEEQALALARLMARCQAKAPRKDTILVLSRRWDCAISEEARVTKTLCEELGLSTLFFQSTLREMGHPDGCFGLWAGTAEGLYQMLIGGQLSWLYGRHVFFFEPDGIPLSLNFVDLLISAHDRTTAAGKRVTGAIMDRPWPHVNGNMIMDLQVVKDYPSLMDCPSGVAWDLHQGPILVREARDGRAIQNVCGSKDWTAGVLAKLACESAWLHGFKDDSAFRWAKNTMLGGRDDSRSVSANVPKRLPVAPVPVPLAGAPCEGLEKPGNRFSF